MGPSPLESLPTELLVAVLSASRSSEDLFSFICASPTVYAAFTVAKRVILTSILSRDLGLAIRDCFAAVVIFPLQKLRTVPVVDAIRQYKALPSGFQVPKDVSFDALTELVRLNRCVQYLVQQYMKDKTSEFEIIHPDAAGPLTVTESRRLARTFLRHHILTRIDPSGYQLSKETSSLFMPWEMQQLADIAPFIQAMIKKAAQRDGWAGHHYWRDKLKRDIRMLHRKLVELSPERANDTKLEGPLRQKMSGLYVLDTRRLSPRPTREDSEVYRREGAMARLVFKEDQEHAPPFAWVDAHGGINCQRWGLGGLARWPRERPTVQQTDSVPRMLKQWRWMGFVFWDRNRVEKLKDGLPEFSTGWLTGGPA